MDRFSRAASCIIRDTLVTDKEALTSAIRNLHYLRKSQDRYKKFVSDLLSAEDLD